MRTEELVSLLAAGGGAVERKSPALRIGIAVGAGLIGAALLMVVLLGVRADLRDAAGYPMFWIKLVFAALLALASVMATLRLSRPGVKVGLRTGLAAPLLAVWALAAFVLIDAEPASRGGLLFGHTWKTCPLIIALLSIPVFIAMLWAMRGLAPTRLRLAGAAVGLASGTLAALVYTLHCPESTPPFLAVWYVMGMLIPTAVGALIGRRVLLW
jgi:hypothetical protein